MPDDGDVVRSVLLPSGIRFTYTPNAVVKMLLAAHSVARNSRRNQERENGHDLRTTDILSGTHYGKPRNIIGRHIGMAGAVLE